MRNNGGLCHPRAGKTVVHRVVNKHDVVTHIPPRRLPGTVTKGVVTKGMVTRGVVTTGMITKGVVTGCTQRRHTHTLAPPAGYGSEGRGN